MDVFNTVQTVVAHAFRNPQGMERFHATHTFLEPVAHIAGLVLAAMRSSRSRR